MGKWHTFHSKMDRKGRKERPSNPSVSRYYRFVVRGSYHVVVKSGTNPVLSRFLPIESKPFDKQVIFSSFFKKNEGKKGRRKEYPHYLFVVSDLFKR